MRQSVQRLYKQIMPHVSSDMIGPFFPILSAHLCCAMTHIHDEIQLDSLSLLGEYHLHKFTSGYMIIICSSIIKCTVFICGSPPGVNDG